MKNNFLFMGWDAKSEQHHMVESAGPYLGYFVCGGKLCTPSQGPPVYDGVSS